jgi:hypothetical protein
MKIIRELIRKLWLLSTKIIENEDIMSKKTINGKYGIET